MKKNLCLLLPGMLALALLTGCLSPQQDSGQKTEAPNPTIGQQMNDLLKARNSGAITEKEFQVRKDQILNQR